MKLSELLGKQIVSENGKKLGHVFDVKTESRPLKGEIRKSIQVEALVYGKQGLLERFGIEHKKAEISWEQVLEIQDKKILVRMK